MKKVLCILLSLVLLLSFAACKKEEEAPKEKSDEEKIEELLVSLYKSQAALATREELRSIHTEAYWESKKGTLQDFDRRAENGGASTVVTVTADGEPMTQEDVKQWFKETYGEDYVITAEIKETETIDYSEMEDEKFKYFFPHLQKADIDEARSVTFVICIKGEKKVQEQEEKTFPVLKIDGKWYLQ